jgi:catechol-2,3-dioxygenase
MKSTGDAILRTNDLEAVETFYNGVLSFAIVADSERRLASIPIPSSFKRTLAAASIAQPVV